jgi:hypothetical protein
MSSQACLCNTHMCIMQHAHVHHVTSCTGLKDLGGVPVTSPAHPLNTLHRTLGFPGCPTDPVWPFSLQGCVLRSCLCYGCVLLFPALRPSTSLSIILSRHDAPASAVLLCPALTFRGRIARTKDAALPQTPPPLPSPSLCPPSLSLLVPSLCPPQLPLCALGGVCPGFSQWPLFARSPGRVVAALPPGPIHPGKQRGRYVRCGGVSVRQPRPGVFFTFISGHSCHCFHP